MEWILGDIAGITFHTDLSKVTTPFSFEIDNYNWLITDFEFNTLPGPYINYDKDYFILTSEDFRSLILANTQVIWGVILAFPKQIVIRIDVENLPYADGNERVWERENIQHPEAEIEIDCIDSSFTIVKFRKESTSNRFHEYFQEAIQLEKFKK